MRVYVGFMVRTHAPVCSVKGFEVFTYVNRQSHGTNNISHMKKACDVYIPIISGCSDSVPCSSRVFNP